MRKRLNSKGFTIIELMIATSVFSVILLVCATGLIQIARMYQKGVIRSQTQEVARSVIVNIAESIQFSGGDVTNLADSGSVKGFCVDNKRFSFIYDRKLVDTVVDSTKETAQSLVTKTLNGCAASTPDLTTVESNELLAPNMRLVELSVCRPGNCSQAPTGSHLYYVIVKIAYGDKELFDSSGNCISIRLGGSFCATSSLSTTVQRRIIK